MKIILIARVSGLGKVGDVVEVKNGYAKNFLIPLKKAISYSANSKNLFDIKRSEYEKASDDVLDLANHVRKEFIGKNLVVIENASDDGRLYGSVSSSLISSKINKELGKEIVKKTDVILAKPIKEIGVYDVKVEIHCDVNSSIRLVVCRLESEVESLISSHDKALKQAAKNAEEEAKSDKKDKKSDEVDPKEDSTEESKEAPKEEKSAE